MSLPLVVLPTYARIRWLEEQLACLLAQDVDCEVLIANDCPWQRIEFLPPPGRVRVRCFNCSPFPNMGSKRNALMALAGGRQMLWVEDDDICLPWTVSRFTNVRRNGAAFVTSINDYSMHKNQWTLARWPLACMGPADDWMRLGGAPPIDCGDDQHLHRLVRDTAQQIDEPAYIYRWGQGTYHLSGKGVPLSFPQYRADAQKRREAGKEPDGRIQLIPCLRERYWDHAPDAVKERLSKYPANLWDYDLT